MPIVVPCPQCATRLSAPDSAAGKHVKCPKPGCGALAEVPALLPVEEVPVVDATVAPPRPRRVEAVEDDEDARPAPRRKRRRDDDDDYEFDHPRRRRKKSGMGAGTIVAVVLGGLVVLGGVGFGVYALVSKEGDTARKDNGGGNTSGGLNTGGSGVKAPVPAGWVLYTSTNGKFRAYFPKSPLATTTNVSSLPGMPLDMVMTGGPRERLAVIIYVMPIPPQAAGVNRDQIAEQIRLGVLMKQGKTRVLSERKLTWSGRPALEMTLESSNKKAIVTYRQIVTEKCLYLAFFACSTGPSPDEESGFFDNFELLN